MDMIRVDLTERIAWITLDRPPVNVMTTAMMRELDAAIADLAHNDDASVVVISGGGERAFCAGVDVADHTPDKAPEMIDVFHSMLRRLSTLEKVTVASIDGAALGGGLELALMCDMVVASERSKMGFPEIKLACFPPAAVAMLPGICGRPVASDLVLTGETVSAQRALAMGLVSRVLPVEGYDEELRLVVAGLAERSPAVLRLATRTLRSRMLAGLDQVMGDVERVYKEQLLAEPDMAEGMAAFLEKRSPTWKG